jgi:hypothetical protein
MREPWTASIEWCNDHLAFTSIPAPREATHVIERAPTLQVVEQLRDALEHARAQEVSGRHDWCDDAPVLDALETARHLLVAHGGHSHAKPEMVDPKVIARYREQP